MKERVKPSVRVGDHVSWIDYKGSIATGKVLETVGGLAKISKDQEDKYPGPIYVIEKKLTVLRPKSVAATPHKRFPLMELRRLIQFVTDRDPMGFTLEDRRAVEAYLNERGYEDTDNA